MILRNPTIDENNLLFVYGTLLSGLNNHHFLQGATCLGSATLPGALFDLGDYPGLIVAGALALPLAPVMGELYEVKPAQWAQLDALEQFDPQSMSNSMYLRQWAEVTWLKTGAAQSQRAQVYVYNWPLTDRPRIENGDFRRHISTKKA